MKGESWQIVLPLANPPEFVHLSSDEMGMLISWGCDEVFNAVMESDAIHNSLVSAIATFNKERVSLGERLAAMSDASSVDGDVVSGTMHKDQARLLRPKMIDVNSLVNSIMSQLHSDTRQIEETLKNLHSVLRDELGVAYRLSFKTKSFPE